MPLALYPGMKKFVVAILAFLYLGTSIGATVHLHYCMDKLVDWSLWNYPDSKCGECGMEKNHGTTKDGCCKDEQKTIKNTKDEKLNQAISYLIQTPSVIHTALQNELPATNVSSITETNPISHAPPRSQAPIYIRNRVFLI